jgi:hypothetical protein
MQCLLQAPYSQVNKLRHEYDHSSLSSVVIKNSSELGLRLSLYKNNMVYMAGGPEKRQQLMRLQIHHHYYSSCYFTTTINTTTTNISTATTITYLGYPSLLTYQT